MATKYTNLIRINMKHSEKIASKEYEAEIKKAVEDWEKWIDSGEWEQVLFALDDPELIDMATKVKDQYMDNWTHAVYWQLRDLEQKMKVKESLGVNNPELIRIQALINERLEQM